VTLAAARPAEWYLQSDTPFAGSGTRFQNAAPGAAGLRITMISPAAVASTTARATVQAPGAPGSIEKGTQEERGYVLRITAPAAASHRFEATLEVQPPRR
jgi:hypothetical protein